MPRNKDLKRLVRARMAKTGEAYTAARAQIIKKRDTRPPTAAPATPSDAMDYAARAGMSDAVIRAKTGCTWERWVRTLDRHGAERMAHGDITKLVARYKTGPWWTQMVAVGYERIKGLRARGQRRDGSYEATKSRTYAVPVAALFDAWADDGVRARWLIDAPVRIRTATRSKSMRLDWPDGGIVAVGFTAKGPARSAVAVAHARLPDREDAERIKRYWSERLDALGVVLTDGQPRAMATTGRARMARRAARSHSGREA